MTADLGIGTDQVAAVGDSFRDVEMLAASGRAYYVGETLPDELADAHHVPDGDVAAIAEHVLDPTGEL